MENQSDTNLFDQWNQRKQEIDHKQAPAFVHEREIWWCAIGLNIGHEEKGKGDQFERPVLILRKFNNEIVLPEDLRV